MLDLESQELECIFSVPSFLMGLTNGPKGYCLPHSDSPDSEFEAAYLLEVKLLGNDLGRNFLKSFPYMIIKGLV